MMELDFEVFFSEYSALVAQLEQLPLETARAILLCEKLGALVAQYPAEWEAMADSRLEEGAVA